MFIKGAEWAADLNQHRYGTARLLRAGDDQTCID